MSWLIVLPRRLLVRACCCPPLQESCAARIDDAFGLPQEWGAPRPDRVGGATRWQSPDGMAGLFERSASTLLMVRFGSSRIDRGSVSHV
eukprot:308383-Amphidinium_carterae.1